VGAAHETPLDDGRRGIVAEPDVGVARETVERGVELPPVDDEAVVGQVGMIGPPDRRRVVGTAQPDVLDPVSDVERVGEPEAPRRGHGCRGQERSSGGGPSRIAVGLDDDDPSTRFGDGSGRCEPGRTRADDEDFGGRSGVTDHEVPIT